MECTLGRPEIVSLAKATPVSPRVRRGLPTEVRSNCQKPISIDVGSSFSVQFRQTKPADILVTRNGSPCHAQQRGLTSSQGLTIADEYIRPPLFPRLRPARDAVSPDRDGTPDPKFVVALGEEWRLVCGQRRLHWRRRRGSARRSAHPRLSTATQGYSGGAIGAARKGQRLGMDSPSRNNRGYGVTV